MTEPSGYVLEPLREGADFTLYRGRQQGNPSPVLVVALTAEQPSPGGLLQLSDVLADRRLAQAQPLGGPGEIPGLGNRQESLKQDGIQHGSIITMFDYNNRCMQYSQ